MGTENEPIDGHVGRGQSRHRADHSTHGTIAFKSRNIHDCVGFRHELRQVIALAEAGEYFAGTGGNTAGIGTRFQYRFTKAFRAWLTLGGQRDVDSGGHVTRSGSVAAGAGFRW